MRYLIYSGNYLKSKGMNVKNNLSRRGFLQSASCLSAAAVLAPFSAEGKEKTRLRNTRKKPDFTLWQIPSHSDTIGNSYVFQTKEGKVIVMDGGFEEEAFTLRGFIGALGNEVEAWFISHPHSDHMGALNKILKDPQDLKIKRIFHSRLSEAVTDAEPGSAALCREFYKQLDGLKDIEVVDMQLPGEVFRFDGMNVKVLGIANEYTTNPYNNSSTILRVWDRSKSIVFLGDAGVECGDKVLNGPFRDDLNCEYLQMAHHGQQGCSEEFYRSIRFRACLWPTPTWVWNNNQGKGFNTGNLKTVETRSWMDRLKIQEHHVSCLEGLYKLC